MNGTGRDYRDTAMFTKHGYQCLFWEDMMNQSVNPFTNPNAGLERNYCRNPNNESHPWCYYLNDDNSTEWEYCTIKQCETNALSSFNRAILTYISGYNKKYILGYNMTAERCAIGCLTETSFVCRAFEFREIWPHDDRTCIMTNESLYTLDQYKSPRIGPAIDLFTRIDTICDAYRAPRIPNDCPFSLGIEIGSLNATHLTSSSNQEGFEPSKARLNSNTSWIPSRNNDSEWLQVEFQRRMLITGIISQGGGDNAPYWVESFEVEYSEDGIDWWYIEDLSSDIIRSRPRMTFRANGEPHCSRPIIFDRPVRTNYIRIVPKSWNGSIAMRIDIIGCIDDDCHFSSGISGGGVRKTQLISSTSGSADHTTSDARINPYHSFGSGWMPYQSDEYQWIKVLLDYQWQVNTILTQGCGDLPYWVTSFHVFYLLEDDVWAKYKSHRGAVRVFQANHDQHTLITHSLDPPIISQSIQIQPLSWYEQICLRFEILGCRHRLCSHRLGMESGAITDDQLSGTSYYGSLDYSKGRLHHPACWEASHVLDEEWIQIDLISMHTITGLITQGRGKPGAGVFYWVKTYAVLYQSRFQHGDWRTYRNLDGQRKIFVANDDKNSEVRNDFERPFVTTKIRVTPMSWQSSLACMRLEVLGCLYQDTGDFCSENAVNYEGFCLGTVDSQDPDACDAIFAEGSYPITINGDRIQFFLHKSFNQLRIEDRDCYVIGLQSATQMDNVTFQWIGDGTPVTYSNFKDLRQEIQNISREYCVSVNSYDFSWSAYPCKDNNKARATLCQIDINECVGGETLCTHSCHNYPGSYACTCPPNLYLDGRNNCTNLCSGWEIDTPLQGQDRCFTYPTKASWSDALATCSMSYMRIVTLDDVTNTDGTKINLEAFAKENEWIWVRTESDDYDQRGIGRNSTFTSSPITTQSVCSTMNVVNEAKSVMVQMRNCDDIAAAMCVREFDDIRCEDMWLNNITSIRESSSLIGYIQSLNFPPWYNTGSMCLIHFYGPEEMVYRFRFLQMNLRRNYSVGGCHDALKITDNITGRGVVHRGTYCGQQADLVVVTRSNDVQWELSIGHLTADMDYEIGLVAYYEAIECSKESCNVACDVNNTLTTFPGSFSSYGFPSTVPPFSLCHWVIQAAEDSFIKLYLSDFRVECIDAVYLTEYEMDTQLQFGVPSQGGFCDEAPPLYISETSRLIVVYSTGLDAPSLGFKADYEIQATPGCGFGLTTASEIECHLNSAVFASLYYPKSFVHQGGTSWTIITDPGTYIELLFLEFDVPSQANCFPGRVNIYDSSVRSTESIAEYCNVQPPDGYVLSSRNELLVEYISPNTDDDFEGFYAEYHARVFSPSNAPEHQEDDAEQHCDEDWILVDGYCYMFSNMSTPLHWNAAQRYCTGIGSNLVSIRNYPEVNFIQTMLVTDWFTEDPRTYIGLTDRVKEGHFAWIDQSPMSYTDWFISRQFLTESDESVLRSQPDGDNLEDCTMIILDTYHSTANWHDVSCASKEAKQFICKKRSKGRKTTSVIADITLTDQEPICISGLIRCSNGECIHPTYRCSNLVTESNAETPCSLGFQCDNGECISLSFYCDFVNDCSDNSDEKYCTYRNCTVDEFRCDNDECIPKGLECNLIIDCIDGTDEGSFCDKCSEGFQCYDGSCLYTRAYCDASKDCAGNHWEDEPQTCPYHEETFACKDTQLSCMNRECIDTNLLCMYEFDQYGYNKGCRDVSHLRYCESFQCPSWSLKCPSSYCIPLRFRCNDVIDCPDGEDEYKCDVFTCPGAYRCHGASFCVQPGEVCDGIQQCPMGDDELFCGIICPEGCSCSGLSLECRQVTWDSTIAASVPDNIRQLNLIGISNTRRRRDADVSASNVTIEDILQTSLDRFLLLADLDLSQNGISLLTHGTFINLNNLKGLSLSYNQINELPNSAFIGLRLLKHLNLIGNPLTRIAPGAFLQLTKLPQLDLSGMHVTHLPAGTFKDLVSLANLSLISSSLNEIVPGAFEGLDNLQEIDIRENPLRKVQEDIFQGLIDVKTLKADRYLFCCLIGEIESCIPEADQFSSCADLMRNRVLRVCIWILGLSALVGNIFVILWRTKIGEESARSKVQEYLILNLAVADLLMGVYMITIAGADMYYRDVYILHADNWQTGKLCKLAGLLSTLSCELSLFILAVISLDRFWCITFATKCKRLQLEHARIITIIAWVIALVLSIIPVVGLKYFGDDFYGRSSVCLALPLTADRPPGWEYSVMLFLGVNLCSFIIICFCYLNIYCTVNRTSKRMRRNKKRAAEIKMAARMAFIVATDFSCWMPIFIMAIMSMTGIVTLPGDVYAWTAVFILPLNSSLNPYLYTFSTVNLKRHIHALIGDQFSSADGDSAVDRTLLSPLRSMISVNNVPPRILLSEMGKRSDLLFMSQSDIASIKADLLRCLRELHHSKMACEDITHSMIMLEQDKNDKWHAGLIVTPSTGMRLKGPDQVDNVDVLMDKNMKQIENIISEISNSFAGESTV
ncbi:uncharacterized protein [Amphiura filiformis]|uniref:uncharacterized protein n=1 Tax=Amphiura filiformis TaxID=82378 RepID=UPI003B21AD86